MNRTLFGIATATLLLSTIIFWWACLVYAAPIPDTYTNDNFWESIHDAPVSFVGTGSGGYYGYTTTGKYFEQLPVVNDLAIRLHRFSIDSAWYYISDQGIIQAETDIIALSIYLGRIG